MSFAELGLSEPIVRAVRDAGYAAPTPIQTQAIPLVLEGLDLLAGAQTGTGKTAGFALPILELLSRPPRHDRKLRALILAPTRELAAQIDASFKVYGKHVKLTSTAVFGGVGINPQIAELRRGVDIVVATPGRLLDLAGQKMIDLSGIKTVVLDEADRMLDMGFIHDITRVLALLPKQRQSLLFSATFSEEIRALAGKFLTHPRSIEVARRNSAVEIIEQRMHPVDRERKRELLSQLISSENWYQVLVFTRTKHGANRLAEQLSKDGLPSLAIHGNKSQGARTRALAEFKSGNLRVLVATDLAARGIDISELPVVVNFELPQVAEDYVHRIGRTGRAGATGLAVSLVCVDEHGLLADIERVLKTPIAKVTVDGFAPDPRIRAEPVQKQRGQRPPAQARRPARADGSGGHGQKAKPAQAPKGHAAQKPQPSSGRAAQNRGPAKREPASGALTHAAPRGGSRAR